ncbi:Mrp/NBP35 family ATP-binding protein [candidate division WOR-3 bacterium]|nr:Mrp/NBP35 family ATP-binding protein [candidate division WOR-3 bacterium]MCK4528485.1 Mrp/NBP35 family ATP-binding protein [candidate division WOR-3 bacterium]
MLDEKSRTIDMQSKINENIKGIKRIVMVMSGKGGVGKSTVASNLALSLAQKGDKVGLLDIDIHGPNLPKMLGVEKERMASSGEGRIEPVAINDNLKLVSMAFLLEDEKQAVIWRGPLKMKVIRQFLGDIVWGEIDWLIVDAPPGTGDEPLSMAQLVPATGAIIVTTPQEVSILDVRKSVVFAQKLGLRILGIVENMSGLICPHCGEKISLFKEGGGERVADEMGVPFLGSIPIDPDIVEATDKGTPYIKEHPDSPAANAFEKIVQRIRKKKD